jgi:3-methylcrotonyl-CoA carboxylase beta subunit
MEWPVEREPSQSTHTRRMILLYHYRSVARFSPRFLWMWPNARVSVMGPDQLQDVMNTISKFALPSFASSSLPSLTSLETFRDTTKTAGLKDRILKESEATYCSARLWDDGIIQPSDTRSVLGLGLAVAMKSWDVRKREKGNFGPFRF